MVSLCFSELENHAHFLEKLARRTEPKTLFASNYPLCTLFFLPSKMHLLKSNIYLSLNSFTLIIQLFNMETPYLTYYCVCKTIPRVIFIVHFRTSTKEVKGKDLCNVMKCCYFRWTKAIINKDETIACILRDTGRLLLDKLKQIARRSSVKKANKSVCPA